LSPYAVSKLAGEYYAKVYSDLFGVETVTLRYFNVFGPRQDPAGAYAAVIPKFIGCALRGEALPIHGDGGQTRDFTYIDNVVDANQRAATASGAAGRLFNIACGGSISLLDLVDALRSLLPDQQLQVQHLPARPGDVRDSLADVSLARQILGYDPKVSVREGIARTFEWYRARA
jgi:nucleoside-diphosphate-sugar epimerase